MLRYGFLALFVAVATFGSAAQDGNPAPESANENKIKVIEIGKDTPPYEEACFNVRDIRSFSALDSERLYARGRRDEHFLITVYATCFGLQSALQIAISGTVGRVCSTTSATIAYRSSGQLEQCRIRQVEAVEDRDAAKELAEARRRAARR